MLIKLGDMLIASPLPKALKQRDPGTHISWLVDSSCVELLRMNPYIDEVIEYSPEALIGLGTCSFDLVLGFEREKAAAALVEQVRAHQKFGLAFGGTENGIYPLSKNSEYFFKLNTWNDFRTQINQKTWTEFYFELAGLNYAEEPYELEPPGKSVLAASQIVTPFTIESRPFVIFNLGGSLPIKIWPREHWSKLLNYVLDLEIGVILTYGSEDVELMRNILLSVADERRHLVLAPDTRRELGTLAAIFRLANAVVTGDTFGMHLAIWAQKPTMALFGPSNPAEVIPKHASYINVIRSSFECSPCAHQVECGGVGGCMRDIPTEKVATQLRELLLANQPKNGEG